jgi:two-component system response regulator DesR
VERQLAWSYLLRALWSHGRHSPRRPARGLIDGIRRVAAGQRVVDPELVAAAIDVGPRPSPPASADVLDAAHSGAGTEEIAATAHLLPVTVRHCLSNAITKVGRRNRLDAIRIAGDAGWR